MQATSHRTNFFVPAAQRPQPQQPPPPHHLPTAPQQRVAPTSTATPARQQGTTIRSGPVSASVPQGQAPTSTARPQPSIPPTGSAGPSSSNSTGPTSLGFVSAAQAFATPARPPSAGEREQEGDAQEGQQHQQAQSAAENPAAPMQPYVVWVGYSVYAHTSCEGLILSGD